MSDGRPHGLVRPATAADVESIRQIQHAVPSPELLALAGGDESAARRLGFALTTEESVLGPSLSTVVLEREGRAVGFLQYVHGRRAAAPLTWGAVLGAVRALGPGALRLPRRLGARSTVALEIPPDSLHLAELHVHPDHRGRGAGAALLRWAADRAGELGAPTLSLITGTSNPARRLYERHGFVVARTAESARYEQVFGQRGRVLMLAPTLVRDPG